MGAQVCVAPVGPRLGRTLARPCRRVMIRGAQRSVGMSVVRLAVVRILVPAAPPVLVGAVVAPAAAVAVGSSLGVLLLGPPHGVRHDGLSPRVEVAVRAAVVVRVGAVVGVLLGVGLPSAAMLAALRPPLLRMAVGGGAAALVSRGRRGGGRALDVDRRER
jgi:hypothetical protein